MYSKGVGFQVDDYIDSCKLFAIGVSVPYGGDEGDQIEKSNMILVKLSPV